MYSAEGPGLFQAELEASILVARFAGELEQRLILLDLPAATEERATTIDGVSATLQFYRIGDRGAVTVGFSVPYRPPDRGKAIYHFYGNAENDDLLRQFLDLLSTPTADKQW